LLVAGILLAVAGYGFGISFPIIKKIWTSSFMLVTSGWAFLVFALFYWLIEIIGVKTGTKPWIVFGSNAIAIYVLAEQKRIFIKLQFKWLSKFHFTRFIFFIFIELNNRIFAFRLK